MEKKFRKSLFLFRRDFRLEDNTGLIFALNHSETVIPAFIFTPEQIEHNPYRSDRCLQFMIESLQDLENQLKEKGGTLYLFQGKPEEIVSKCIVELNINAVIVNRDYTPYSQERDKRLEKACHSHHVSFHTFDDALLHPPEETLKADGKPYVIFTPYFRNASKQEILQPISNQNHNYFSEPIPFSKKKSLFSNLLPPSSPGTHLPGGRTEALKILKNLSAFNQYEQLRDFPAKNYSTHLSPYLKFTVCSPRELYRALCRDLDTNHELIRSIHWRDFFTTIAFFFPHVFKSSFHPKFDTIQWSHDEKIFQKWCDGLTGFPIVDAGMRELNTTGFMHNRVRMIAGSFLVKDLHIDWRWGEQYFAKKLIDYDPAVNNGNWQWVASTGCDAQPYFRIFNPWNQQEKFDQECLYIKKLIPELCPLPPKMIHHWDQEQYHAECSKYPPPMVDHRTAAQEAIRLYKSTTPYAL